MIYSFDGKTPHVPDSVYLAPGARVLGDVKIGEESSIWFNTVIRGDVNRIVIGSRTNIQDNSVLHVTYQKFTLTIGNGVTVGHAAILHGCVVEDFCLIGMGARVLDGAIIGHHSLVAAGALVREGEKVPPNSLVAGIPAKIKRELREDEIQNLELSAERYVGYKNAYLKGGSRLVTSGA